VSAGIIHVNLIRDLEEGAVLVAIEGDQKNQLILQSEAWATAQGRVVAPSTLIVDERAAWKGALLAMTEYARAAVKLLMDASPNGLAPKNLDKLLDQAKKTADQAHNYTPASSTAMTASAVRELEWQATFVDRGDGSMESSGWEADSGFGVWYEIKMGFGSDSYCWPVYFDSEIIADCDDPEQAKERAQKHYAERILAALSVASVSLWQEITPDSPNEFRKGYLVAREGSPAIRAYRTPGGDWFMHGANSEKLSGEFEPTHWQPLPSGPQPQGGTLS